MPIFAFSGSLTRPAPNYGEANGGGITSFAFDDETGQLLPVAEFGGIDDSAWLTLDAKRNRLYAICEVRGADQSAVASFAIDQATGALTALNRQPTGGQTACHASLSSDGQFLLVANYNAVVPPGAPDGAVRAFPLGPDGTLEPASASVTHKGSGPNVRRQERSHAHCAVPSPNGRFLYVADLGLDRIVVYAIGADGGLTPKPASDFAVPPGLGPRHLVFGANGKMAFLVSELVATVLALRVDPATGAMTQAAAFPIPALDGGVVQSAGIVLTADDRFLFISLRVCDEILGLAVDTQTGILSQTGRWPSGGRTPRDLVLSPSGKHLLVANQDSDTITIFRIDQRNGTLSDPIQQQHVGTPMAITLAQF